MADSRTPKADEVPKGTPDVEQVPLGVKTGSTGGEEVAESNEPSTGRPEKFQGAPGNTNATGNSNAAPIRILRVDSDSDSAIADVSDVAYGIFCAAELSTASLRSSIYEKVEENGRTYHKYKEGSYLLPNDELEQNRLDIQHHLCKLTLHGNLHLAPIESNPNNVLDFGTGTGIWAIEFAEQYPSANVLGTDLSPIQPLYVPPNCRFEIDDAEDDWLYTQKFDYIHGRLMAICFKDPAAVFKKAFNSCKPGGYFEMFDFTARIRSIDDSFEGTALQKFSNMMIEGALNLGKNLTHAPKYKEYFEAAGFVDIVEEQFHWPINTWPKGNYYKTLGLWYNQDMLEGLSGMSMATLTRGLKMSREEVELFLVDVRNDFKNKKIHAYLPIYVVYGRRPE